GDWQLLPWIGSDRAVPAVGRWKMVDNLRRSLLAPAAFLALALCCLMPLRIGIIAAGAILVTLAIPALLPALFAIIPGRPGLQWRAHLRGLFGDLRMAGLQIGLGLAFLPDQSWRNGD